MTARLITPPAALAVSLAAAKGALRIEQDDTSRDSEVTGWVEGVVGDAEFLTGRAFVTQGWRVTLDAFPEAIELLRAPLAEVTSVRYVDQDGQLQTLDPDDYQVDDVSEPGYVVPAPGKAWPATAARINSVMVDYICGYGADDTAVPATVKLYVIGKLVEQFDPAPRTDQQNVQSAFLARLLDGLKVYA